MEPSLKLVFACFNHGLVLVGLGDPMLGDGVVDILFLGTRVCKHLIERLDLGNLSVCSLMLLSQLTLLDGDLRSDASLNPGVLNPLQASHCLIHRQVLRISGPLLNRTLLCYIEQALRLRLVLSVVGGGLVVDLRVGAKYPERLN